MNPILRNILAIIAGAVIGSVVNMGLIMISGSIIPLPEGADLTTPEGLKAAIPLFEPKHFIMPFLAHSLGTLVAALIATLIAASHKMIIAMILGFLFLLGGIMMVMDLPSPLWYNVTDLAGAYIPMAFIGWKLGDRK